MTWRLISGRPYWKGEVLIGFDIDACAVGFDGATVFALPRFRRAVNRRFNLVGVDPTR